MPRDFEFGRELGTGSYSVVTAAYLPQNGQTYAIKALDKAHVLRYKQQGNKVDVQMERRALMRLSRPGHPGVVRLFWAMQDQASLYFVLELCPKGDMTTVLRRLGSFSLACARFYFAQITDAVMFIHSQGIVHRDLKPDNFLFTDQWRIKITDFGSAKIIEAAEGSDTPAGSRRTSFVGSPQYVSPEILAHQAVSYPTDLWSMGIVLYQMISGHFPFDSGPTGGMAHYLMWQRVLKGEYSFGEGWDPQAQDLVKKLLVNEPGKRLGAQGGEEGAKELRKAPFFTPLDWASLWTSQVPAFEP
ncbi:Pkinase-domain-containing protein, partial [Calocera cornea HHB12733]